MDYEEPEDDEVDGDDDGDDANDFNLDLLLEDLRMNPNECAFLSTKQKTCLTNKEVYRLLKNRSDLFLTSDTIEKNLNKPNEHTCTSIELSNYPNTPFSPL